jgi:hypothetical protein
MADQAQRGSRHLEPSSRPGSPSGPAAVLSADGPGSASTAAIPGSPMPTGQPHSGTPGRTPRATFWHLQQQGLTAGEAASLTAFMCGLPAADLRWSLHQINQLLFLQRLYQLGRFGIGEGERPRPH